MTLRAGDRKRQRRRGLLWTLARATPLATALLACPVAANDDSDPARPAAQSYNIPAQPLNSALARFAETSGVDVLIDQKDVAGKRSSPAIGVFAPPQALHIILDGTGLVARFTSRRSAVVSRIPANARTGEPERSSAPIADNVIVLDRMEVTAPRTIGGPLRTVSGRFVNEVASQIRRIMTSAGIVERGTDARLRIQLRIRKDGTLHDVRVDVASNDAGRDARIVALLEGARLDVQPPEGMPQPLYFRVSGQ
jgi:hypothetical protein